MKNKIFLGIAVLSLSLILPASSVLAAGTNTEMIPGMGSNDSRPTDINDSGTTVGNSPTKPGIFMGYQWYKGQLTSLDRNGLAYDQDSYVEGVNNNGGVTGTAIFPDSGNRSAYLKQLGKNYEKIPVKAGMINGYATSLNDNGTVVGYQQNYDNQTEAFSYKDGVLTNLPGLGGNYTVANDINEKNQIVGVSSTPDYVQHAVIWENGSIRDLGTLGGFSRANAINEKSEIVGDSYTDVKAGSRPTLWKNGQIIALNIFDDMDYSYAHDINDHGIVIGAGRVGITEKGMYWTPGSTSPNKLIEHENIDSNIPTAINNSGEIVGTARWVFRNGDSESSLQNGFYTKVDIDLQAPTVRIVSPTLVDKLKPNSKVEINVDATDNKGISKVEIYMNDNLVCSDTSREYSCSYTVPTPNHEYTIKAVAHDYSGNTTTVSQVLNPKKR